MAKKKVVKSTTKEYQTIEGRLKKKYPQMYESAVTEREERVLKRATPEDRKMLEKMVGRRLKKIYGGL